MESNMEPMVVSPTKSSPSGGQFLPSFLMGELASPLSGSQCLSPIPTANFSRTSRSKLEGPPIIGLFDEVNSSPPVSPSLNPSLVASSLPYNNSTIYVDASSSLHNQENRNFWVVVYGFPPSHVSQIIAMFSQLGRVTEHNHPLNANWVFLCYSNQSDMRKALSMNQKVLSGNVMIAVTERKHQSMNEAGGVVASTPANSNLAVDVSITSPTTPKIRPLAISRRQNALSPVNSAMVPKADTSIVGKFMDYVFSWQD